MSGRLSLALVTGLTLVALVVGAPALDGSADGTDGSGVSAGQQPPEVSDQTQYSTDRGGVVIAVVLVITAVALGYALTQYGRDDAVLAALTTVILTVAAALVGVRSASVAGTFAAGGSNGSAVDSVTSGGPPAASLWAVGVAGSVVVVAVAGAVFLRGTGTETWSTSEEEPADEPADSAGQRAALGVAAGRAADRLAADTPSENGVYRAWREMADALDVPNPAASTPGEFAAAAERAGMDPDDVATLTDLFESVRYGDSPPTDERERRARQALRNIERTHGGEP